MIENEPLKKKLKKVIEEIILQDLIKFEEIFSEEEARDIIKHKTKISKVASDDNQLLSLIREEVEDIVGVYLLEKSFKQKNKKKKDK